jgi:protein TonB
MFDYLTNARKAGSLSTGTGTIASIVLHAAFIGGVVYERAIRPNGPADSTDEMAEGLIYVAPPNIASAASQVQIRYEASGGDDGTADPTAKTGPFGPRVRGSGPGENAVASVSGGDDVPDQIAAPSEDPYENAFSIVEVEEQAARDPASAAPAYPRELMARGVEGYAAMRFVVDSAGAVDLASVRVLDFTHPEFVSAVKSAMPGMRFTPARLGDKPVRQLAEQLFRFQIEKPVPISGSATAASGSGSRIPAPRP